VVQRQQPVQQLGSDSSAASADEAAGDEAADDATDDDAKAPAGGKVIMLDPYRKK